LNDAASNIVIAGPFSNPAALVNIHNTGNIRGGGENSWINSQNISWSADQGTLGTANERINLRLPLIFGSASGLSQAAGHDGVYLDINWGGHETQFGTITLDNISSSAGSVDLLVHDGYSANEHEVETVTTKTINIGGFEFSYQDRTITHVTELVKVNGLVKLGDISAAHDVIVHVGDGTTVRTDVSIVGDVHAGDTAAITVVNGSVSNGGGTISGHNVIINSQNNGQVGDGDLFIVANVDGGEINAIAQAISLCSRPSARWRWGASSACTAT
jgi:hypothetical protein